MAATASEYGVRPGATVHWTVSPIFPARAGADSARIAELLMETFSLRER
jgi:hypothetical protein